MYLGVVVSFVASPFILFFHLRGRGAKEIGCECEIDYILPSYMAPEYAMASAVHFFAV